MSPEWSSYAGAYDRVLCRTATYQALLTDLLGRTGPLPPLRDGTAILDCGAGTGNLCRALAHALPAATLVAVDRDATMVALFRRKLGDRLSPVPGAGRVCLLEGDLMDVFPLLARHRLQPDYAFLVNVLYLLEDPGRALRAIAACLRPGGELRLSNPDERTDLDVLFRQLEQDLIDAQQLDALRDDFAVLSQFNQRELSASLHRLSGAQIRHLLHAAGFRRITHSTHDHYAGQSVLLSATT